MKSSAVKRPSSKKTILYSTDPSCLLIPHEKLISLQEDMLKKITSSAASSSIYHGRIREIASLADLSSLPLTSYAMIDHAIETSGQDRCLLQVPDFIFQTAGSTGNPKRMYYSKDDLSRMSAMFAIVCKIIGVCDNDIAWNLGGAFPNVSGAFVNETGSILGIPMLTTLLKRDSDLMPAMRKAAKEERIDVVATAALVLYFIARAVREPDFLRGIVRDKLKRDLHLPSFLASLLARLYIRIVNPEKLGRTLSKMRISITYAEPITAYYSDYRESMPETRFYDVMGSTENPVLAAQLDLSQKGLSLFVNAVIAEIADPVDVASALESGRSVQGIHCSEWKSGMRGELLITRPGECLPLLRYPTGDMIEILDPSFPIEVGKNGEKAYLPLIKILGRSVEVLDFEVQDEMGCFLGNKIYSHHIHEALQRSRNVRWWELYNIKGQPGRLCFLVIPEKEVNNVERFRKDILGHLLRECDDPHHTLEIGYELDRLEIVVTRASAYAVIQREIDRRAREGRALGQLKPKRIHSVDGEEAFQTAVFEKLRS